MAARETIEAVANQALCEFLRGADNLGQYADNLPGVSWLRRNVGPYTSTTSIATLLSTHCGFDPPAVGSPNGKCSTGYNLYARVVGTVQANGRKFDTGPYNDGGARGVYTGPIGDLFEATDERGRRGVYARDADGNTVLLANLEGLVDYNFAPDHRRADGGPENCSDQPDPPPTFPDEGITIPSPSPEVPGDITIMPINIGIGGAIIVPVIINAPFFFMQVNININTGIPTIGLPGTNPDGCCSEISPIPPDLEQPEEEQPEEEQPEEEVVAATVTILERLETTKLTTMFQSENPDIYIPALGYINFKYEIGGNTYWSSDIPVKNEFQITANPLPFPAIGVAGTPYGGIRWRVSPLRRAPRNNNQ